MKRTRKIKKVVCAVLVGGLILGCLIGCGDEKDTGKTADTAADLSMEETSISKKEVVFYGPERPFNGDSYEIPEGVTRIAKSAFLSCESLASIKIPKGVTEIGDSAFYMCKSLTSIEVPEGTDVSQLVTSKVQIIYY